jgi:uncharacterized membrane protein YoaK (UPF0700 family)
MLNPAKGTEMIIFGAVILGMMAGAIVSWSLTSRHYQAKLEYLYARNRALSIRASRGN